MFRFDNSRRPTTFLPAPDGVVAQLVERLNGIQEVRGSNPLGSTILPEHRICAIHRFYRVLIDARPSHAQRCLSPKYPPDGN
jgi:hypothetical protein